MTDSHVYWMRRALQLAGKAKSLGEVPVGAVIVKDDEIIGEGFNQPITSNDPSAHAEIVALRDAGARVGNYRLPGAILYVTIEPCTMCAGALIHARVAKVVFGAREPKAGALVSNLHLHEAAVYNHRLAVEEGPLARECGTLLSDFFRNRRK
jgi:tRNA(adenine34) deaminase